MEARDQIKESERKFRVLAETAYDAIIMADAESTIQFFNNAAERIFGYSHAEVTGKKLNVLFPDEVNSEDQEGIMQYVNKGIKRLSGYTTELTGRRKSGQDFPAEISLGPWKAGGNTFFVCVIRDITQRKKLQELIYSYAYEVFDLYNGAPCGYHSLNKKGYYMEINQTELDWLGFEKNEVIRLKKFSDQMTEWSAKKFESRFRELLSGVSFKNEEFELVRKDGSTFPVLISATPIMDADGKFVRTRSTVMDITQRKQQEETEIMHRASERNLQQLENQLHGIA
jgi:PAS domain S-box-containing protein